MKTLLLFAILGTLLAGFSGNAVRMELLLQETLRHNAAVERTLPTREPGL